MDYNTTQELNPKASAATGRASCQDNSTHLVQRSSGMQTPGEDGGYVLGRSGWIGIEHVDSGASEFLDVKFLYLQLRALSVND